MKFFSSSNVPSTKEIPVASPYVRAHFNARIGDKKTLKVAVVGLYRLYINGKDITRGFLSPYRSNPNHFVFGDTYDLTPYLADGDNVIGLRLGNGFSSSEIVVWDFKSFSWRHAPKVALILIGEEEENIEDLLYKDSDIIFDDFHSGEWVNMNKTLQNWAKPDLDDSNWCKMLPCEAPKGKIVFEDYPPIRTVKTKKAVAVFKGEGCTIVDFGESGAGTFKITLQGEKGKEVFIHAGDALSEGKRLHARNLICWSSEDPDFRQGFRLTLSGKKDTYSPTFILVGCRYLEIRGLSEEEAKTLEASFTYMSSLPEARGHFECDNEKINYLQEITLRSDVSNFYYYPYDCPQREKNGWTGDAALSCEQLLLNFDCADQFRRWIRTVVAAQNEEGAIPGIVPTDTWGYGWGSGPGWDIALFEIPYRCYLYSGDKGILEDVEVAIGKYLSYMLGKKDEKGLFHYGLPDWQPVDQMTPLEATDTIYCKAIADLASLIYSALGKTDKAMEAERISASIKESFNKAFPEGSNVMESTQAWLSMGIYYGIYDRIGNSSMDDYNAPLYLLLKKLDVSNNHMNHGALANRAIYRVLAEYGEIDRAVTMLTTDYPSLYSMHHEAGATTLFEAIYPKGIRIDDLPPSYFRMNESFNHHFYGDISSFFYRHLAGIQVEGPNKMAFAPCFAKEVKHVKADYMFECGLLKVEIEHDAEKATASIDLPKGLEISLKAPLGYEIADEKTVDGKLLLAFVKD